MHRLSIWTLVEIFESVADNYLQIGNSIGEQSITGVYLRFLTNRSLE